MAPQSGLRVRSPHFNPQYFLTHDLAPHFRTQQHPLCVIAAISYIMMQFRAIQGFNQDCQKQCTSYFRCIEYVFQASSDLDFVFHFHR